ncbi:MAG: type I DNA topoisomerase [Eubacterium sp.]|nr:type I DNA topoisomerase [Eubacterium sp.]
MSKNLVIVESPAKAKTIKKYLGKNFEVIASEGHVRDLPKSDMGVNVENDFEPHYITIRGKGDLLKTLRKAAAKADIVYLATDPDREGEAISYHLAIALNLPEGKYKRITFNEITKNAVKASIKNARDIDMDLVDAQQARRVLDRLVGYGISPVLWGKVHKRGLSAGRVQSSALKMISDRDAEIEDFIPEEYWTVDALLQVPGQKKPVSFRYLEEVHTREEAEKIKKAAKLFTVASMKESQRKTKAPLPFTTSTLQQTAAGRLNFSTSKTMRVAQQLYEGVDIKGQGTVGLITYLRTDSTRISEEADAAVREMIRHDFGEEYVADEEVKEKKEKRIQDAHEAIRPSDLTQKPADLKGLLSDEQYKLYKLIYERFMASRMKPAVSDSVAVTVDAGGYSFRATTSHISFAGFQRVYPSQEKQETAVNFSGVSTGDRLELAEIKADQHFTAPPAHFTEASLVRSMEENGIGRPSTYAPTISTLLARRYVTKEKKELFITELGTAVNTIMEKGFPAIVDTEFTANMESLLDKIGEGTIQWKVVVRNFYPDLEDAIRLAEENLASVRIADEESDEVCDKCGTRMVIKYGAYGKFLACPNFPACRNTKPFFERIGVNCPKCGKDLVVRRTQKGRIYYGCIDIPNCDFMSWSRPVAKACPQCGGLMTIKGKRLACADTNCGYVEAYTSDEKED